MPSTDDPFAWLNDPHIEPDTAFVAQLHADLKNGPLNLPCFPDIMPRIRQALDDPNSSAEDIVKVVGTEPRLAARLIQTAGSVVFNPSGQPPPNLRAAVTRLGRQLVQSVTMVFVMQQAKAEPLLKPVMEPLDRLWHKSVRVALCCQQLAKLLKVPPDKVFLTGLVHGIGHFYILVRSVQPHSPLSYRQIRYDVVNSNHPELGRAVLLKWGFEDIVANAVGEQLNFNRMTGRAADIVDVMIAGIVLAEAALYLEGDLSLTETVTAFHRMNLDMHQLQAVMAHVEHSFEALCGTLSV